MPRFRHGKMVIEVIVIVLITYLAAILIVWVSAGMWQVLPSAWATMAAPFQSVKDTAAQGSAREHLLRELRARVEGGIRPDEHLLDAARATTNIQIAHVWLKQSTTACLDTHWALAKGLGVTDMAEAASHPRAVALRKQNLDLAEFVTDIIRDYPYPTPELIHLEVTVPRLAATCASCPFWFVTRAEAPRVCPSAAALGYQSDRSARQESGVIDAEPVFPED